MLFSRKRAKSTNSTPTPDKIMPGLVSATMQTPPPAGSLELLKAFNSSPALTQTVGRIGQMTARTPWTLFVTRNPRTGKAYRCIKAQYAGGEIQRGILKDLDRAGELEEIYDHPLLECLNSGTTRMSAINREELTQNFIDLIGEAFTLVEANRSNMPTDLFPVLPKNITNLPTSDKPFFTWRKGNGQEVPVAETDIVYMPRPNVESPYKRGHGIGQACADEIQSSKYLASHIKAAFFNNLKPNLLMSIAGAEEAETKDIQAQWRNRFRNIWDRFRPFFLNKAVTVHKLNDTMQEGQVLDMQRALAGIIREVYGVPPEIVGIVENSNRATIESADYLMGKYVIDPRKDFQRSAYQAQLVPRFDDRLILGYASPIPSDKDYELSVAKEMPWILTVDQALAMIGKPPIKDGKGEVHASPFNIRFLKTLEPEPVVPAVEPDKAIKEIQKPDPPVEAMQFNTISVDNKRELTDASIDDLVLVLDYQDLADEMLPVETNSIGHFGQVLLDDAGVGLAFNNMSVSVQEFLNSYGADRVKRINTETQDRIRKALVAGRSEGEVGDVLARRIAGVFEQSRGPRSLNIARTEVGHAQGFAHQQAMMQAEFEDKRWVPAYQNTRDSHMESAFTKIVVAVAELFENTGGTALFPGDFGIAGEDCGCMCVIVPEVAGKSWGVEYSKSIEDRRKFYTGRMRSASIRGFNKQEPKLLKRFNQIGG